MTVPPTLIDMALRESYKKHRPMVSVESRQLLQVARKFILDDTMSSYLADLTNAAYVANPKRAKEMVDGARMLARLPHAVTWIEYNCHARKARSMSEYPQTQNLVQGRELPPIMYPPNREEIIPKVGWLLTGHSKLETAFTMTEFGEFKGAAVELPYKSVWVSDDETVLPWKGIVTHSRDTKEDSLSGAEIATGVVGYKSDKCGIIARPSISVEALSGVLRETVGELRACWSLLATINDLPTTYEVVRPSKGYIARGTYRRFVEHTVITLHVPQKLSLRSLAARAVATIRRRAHMVRGHWRKDHRHPGEKLWIREHQRGDSSLGIVLHDYNVTKGSDA